MFSFPSPCFSYKLFFFCTYNQNPPRWCLHLIVVRGFEYVIDPESYTSGSVATDTAFLAGPVKGRRQTKRDTKTYAGSSVINSDLKHRANDARDSLSSYSNGRAQSDFNGCCTLCGKQVEKLPHYHFSWIVSFQKQRHHICSLRRQNNPEVNYSPTRISEGGGSVSRGSIAQHTKRN